MTCRITGFPGRPDTVVKANGEAWEIFSNAKELASETKGKFGVAGTLETAASKGESRHFDWMDEVDGGGEGFESKSFPGCKGSSSFLSAPESADVVS